MRLELFDEAIVDMRRDRLGFTNIAVDSNW